MQSTSAIVTAPVKVMTLFINGMSYRLFKRVYKSVNHTTCIHQKINGLTFHNLLCIWLPPLPPCSVQRL